MSRIIRELVGTTMAHSCVFKECFSMASLPMCTSGKSDQLTDDGRVSNQAYECALLPHYHASRSWNIVRRGLGRLWRWWGLHYWDVVTWVTAILQASRDVLKSFRVGFPVTSQPSSAKTPHKTSKLFQQQPGSNSPCTRSVAFLLLMISFWIAHKVFWYHKDAAKEN